MSGELAKLGQAARMLAEIKTVPAAANEIDKAAAARVYAQKAKLGREAEDSALAIRMLAERRLGQLVQEGQDAGQIVSHGGDRSKVANADLASLSDLGVTKQQVHEAKLLAHLSDTEIVEHIRDADKASRRKVLKAAAKRAEDTRRPKPPPPPAPTRTPEEQADYDWRQTLRDGFRTCLNFADDCSHPNNIGGFFQGVAERPFDPAFRVDADRIRTAAIRLHHIADEWKDRFPA